MEGLREEARRVIDEKYAPIIKDAVKRLATVQEIAAEIHLPVMSTWRLMRRLGYETFNGWRKAR